MLCKELFVVVYLIRVLFVIAFPIPMDQFHPWNKNVISSHVHTYSNIGAQHLQPSESVAFGEPNQFLQSDGMTYGNDYLSMNHLSSQPHPNNNHLSQADDLYQYHPHMMMDPDATTLHDGHMPHPAYSWPDAQLEDIQTAYSNPYHTMRYDGSSQSQFTQNEASLFFPAPSERLEQSQSEREKEKAIVVEDNIEATKEGAENTNRLVQYDWQKAMDRKDVIKIYRIMASLWIKDSSNGLIKRTSMQKCANNLGTLLDQHEDFPAKILAKNPSFLAHVESKTRPLFTVDRGGFKKEPLWSVEQLIEWLEKPKEISHVRLPAWATPTMTKSDRDAIVSTLCRVWQANPSKVNWRLTAAKNRNGNLVKSMAPLLQSKDEERIQYAANMLMPPIETRTKNLERFNRPDFLPSGFQKETNFGGQEDHTQMNDDHSRQIPSEQDIPQMNHHALNMQQYWQDQPIYSPDLTTFDNHDTSFDGLENWHPLG